MTLVRKDLLKGSLLLLFFFNIFNALNFVFQLLLLRTLSPEEYSIVAVLLPLIFIIAVPMESVQTIVSSLVSSLRGERRSSWISGLLRTVFRRGTSLAGMVFLLSLPVQYFYAVFLSIPFIYVFLLSLTFLLTFLLPPIRGVLQGKESFFAFGSSYFIEGLVKVGCIILFLSLGMHISGAVFSILLGMGISFLFTLSFVWRDLSRPPVKVQLPGWHALSYSVLYSLLIVMLFQNLDVILARRLFSPLVSGNYAAMNTVGKMFFLGTVAISRALLPISARARQNKKEFKEIVLESTGLILLLGILFISLFLFVPQVLTLLIGEDYLLAPTILFPLLLAFLFLSLAQVNIMAIISAQKKISHWDVLLLLTLQILLLFLGRESLLLFSWMMGLSCGLTYIWSLLLFFRKTSFVSSTNLKKG